MNGEVIWACIKENIRFVIKRCFNKFLPAKGNSKIMTTLEHNENNKVSNAGN